MHVAVLGEVDKGRQFRAGLSRFDGAEVDITGLGGLVWTVVGGGDGEAGAGAGEAEVGAGVSE